MFLNINGGPSCEFINAYKEEEEEDGQQLQLEKNNSNNNDDDDILDLTPVEILLNPIAVEQITLVPFNMIPINQYSLVPKISWPRR